MYKFFSRVTSTYIPSQSQSHLGANAPPTHSFPVTQADLELLRGQVRSLVEQKLGNSTLLALAKSTAFEMRKDLIRLNSIADINAILDETDAIANIVFTETGQHIPRFRHALRQEYFQQLIGRGTNFNLDRFKLLQNHAGFPGCNQIQHEIIRCQIESHIQAEYNLAPCRNTQRFSRQSISSVSKGHYAQHCLNLYNLSMPIDLKTTERMIKLRREIRMPREWDQYFQQAHANGTPTHVIIEKLLCPKLGSLGNHNTHPASRLLEFSTGFVFHPNSAANIRQLLNSYSPAAFQNISQLLSDKFLAAYACNNTQYFIESAFVQQDPCFEATVENLIEFKPDRQPNALTVPKAPNWTPLASTEENIEALLDWQEIATLKVFVDSKKIAVKANDHQKIEQILATTEFHAFIRARKTQIGDLLEPIIPTGTPHQFPAQFDARWP